jgi:hypothetical protein
LHSGFVDGTKIIKNFNLGSGQVKMCVDSRIFDREKVFNGTIFYGSKRVAKV